MRRCLGFDPLLESTVDVGNYIAAQPDLDRLRHCAVRMKRKQGSISMHMDQVKVNLMALHNLHEFDMASPAGQIDNQSARSGTLSSLAAAAPARTGALQWRLRLICGAGQILFLFLVLLLSIASA